MTKIEKQVILNDAAFIQFSLETPNNDWNKQEKEERISRIFEFGKVFTVEEITKILKTVFQEDENQNLRILIAYRQHNTFMMHFKDGLLESYTHTITYQKEIMQQVDYIKDKIHFYFSTTQVENDKNKVITEEQERIQRIRNIGAMTLTVNEKRISKLYELFYGQSPDFSKNTTCEKAQYMISILKRYNLFPFSIPDKELENLKRLAPFGKIEECSIKLEKKKKENIKMIGNTIQEYFQKTNQDELTGIKELNRVLLEIETNPSHIEKSTNNTDPEQKKTEESISFIKKLNTSFKKNRYKNKKSPS